MDLLIVLSGRSALPGVRPHPEDAQGWTAGESPANSWPFTVPWPEQQIRRDKNPAVQNLYVFA